MAELFVQIAATSLAEWVAVILSVAYVILAAKQHWLCWPCALISTAIYVVLFWQVALPFQSLLNAYYMIMAVYGFWQWRGRHHAQETLPVTRMPVYLHILVIAGGLGFAYVLAQIFSAQFSSEYLWLDASVQMLSMATTVMVTHKKLENWVYWMVINTAAAWLYWQSGMLLTAALFVFNIGFAAYGLRQWQREMVA